MENLDTALGLLVVGMVTVFIILFLVVLIGNSVIRLTNRFIPVATADKSGGTGDAADRKVEAKKLAAIVAAVEVVTRGKGHVDSIEKR